MSNAHTRLSPIRTDLVGLVKDETGMAGPEAEAFVSRILGTVVSHILDHDVTTIHGFGSFRWVTCKERRFSGGIFGNRTMPAYRKLKFRSTVNKGGKDGDR